MNGAPAWPCHSACRSTRRAESSDTRPRPGRVKTTSFNKQVSEVLETDEPRDEADARGKLGFSPVVAHAQSCLKVKRAGSILQT